MWEVNTVKAKRTILSTPSLTSMSICSKRGDAPCFSFTSTVTGWRSVSNCEQWHTLYYPLSNIRRKLYVSHGSIFVEDIEWVLRGETTLGFVYHKAWLPPHALCKMEKQILFLESWRESCSSETNPAQQMVQKLITFLWILQYLLETVRIHGNLGPLNHKTCGTRWFFTNWRVLTLSDSMR